MSERDTNAKRKIKEAAIAAEVHNVLKGSDRDVPAKDTVPRQADAPQEDQGPAGKEPDQGTEPDRVNDIFHLLKRVLDSDEDPAAAIRSLTAKQDARLMAMASEYAKAEGNRGAKTGELAEALASFEVSVNAIIEESQGMRNLEEARQAHQKIKSIYWDNLVRFMKSGLAEATAALNDDIENARQRLSRRIQALPDQITPPLTLRQRIEREKQLLTCALVLGLVLGSFFGVTGAALWDSAVAVSRQAIRLFGPVVLPLADGFGR